MRAISRCDSCDKKTLRFVCPSCTRDTDGIAAKLLRCGIASEALRRNMLLRLQLHDLWFLDLKCNDFEKNGKGTDLSLVFHRRSRQWTLARMKTLGDCACPTGCLSTVSLPPLVPSQPKLLQKNSLQRKCFEAINFVKITKQSLYKTNSLACFLAKRDTPVAATLKRKSFGGILFVIITKKITKIIVSGNYFVIISARMVQPPFAARSCDSLPACCRLFAMLGARTCSKTSISYICPSTTNIANATFDCFSDQHSHKITDIELERNFGVIANVQESSAGWERARLTTSALPIGGGFWRCRPPQPKPLQKAH